MAQYNDCPKEARCIERRSKNAQGKWVDCECTDKAFRFDPETNACVGE